MIARSATLRVGAAGAVGALAALRLSLRVADRRAEGVWAEQLARRLDERRRAEEMPHRVRVRHTRPARRPGGPSRPARSPGADLAVIAERARSQQERSARRRARVARPPRSATKTLLVAGVVVVGATLVVATIATFRPVHRSNAPVTEATAFPRSASTFARHDIPRSYIRLYMSAGRRYELDWATLAAVGQIESNHGRSPFPGVRSGTNRAGAAGPTQFLAGTWRRYGVDANSDGRISPYEPADAIDAEAAYLRASGAPEDWPRALFAYNHERSYVTAVLRLSRRYEARSPHA